MTSTRHEDDDPRTGQTDAVRDRDPRPRSVIHGEGTVGPDLEFFEPAEPGSLKDQRDLIDEDGDDIRMYTGEPVETDDGWILPQQQNVPGNSAGGGEYPDRETPSTQPDRPDA